MSVIPMVVEKSGHVERYFDIYSRLLKDRIVFIGSPIDDHVANVVVAQMLYLQSESKKDDINLYINSPGGSVSAGLAIYDTLSSWNATLRPSASGWPPVWPRCCSGPAPRANATHCPTHV